MDQIKRIEKNNIPSYLKLVKRYLILKNSIIYLLLVTFLILAVISSNELVGMMTFVFIFISSLFVFITALGFRQIKALCETDSFVMTENEIKLLRNDKTIKSFKYSTVAVFKTTKIGINLTKGGRLFKFFYFFPTKTPKGTSIFIPSVINDYEIVKKKLKESCTNSMKL